MAREEQNKLLRVGIIQDRRVVEERLVRKHAHVSVGQAPKNTFIIPNTALPKSYTLFEARPNGAYALVFERGMDGRIDLGGTPMTLRELARSKQASKRGNQFVVPLSQKARGKIVFGNVTLLFQFVDAPPVMPRPQLPAAAKGGIISQLEWPLVYILIAAFLVLGGGGTGLHVWWLETGQYYYKEFNRDSERLYELLEQDVSLQFEKKKDKEQPKEDPELVENDVAPVEEPAPIEEPKKEPKKVKKRVAAKDRKSTRTKLTDRVRNKTFLHVLGSKAGGGPVGALDTLKNGVHADNLKNAFNIDGGVTEATAGGPTFVGGPSAATADGERYKRLSKSEAGGKRLAAKSVRTGSKESRSEIKVRANVRGGQVSGKQGTGSINKDAVAKVFSRRKGAIKYCYEKRLKVSPNLKGKVTIRFTIGPAGRITTINAASNSTGDGEVARCIMDKVKGWRFEPPKGGSVTFSYPFLLDTQ